MNSKAIKEKAIKEKAIKEKAIKEKAIKEKAIKEKAIKEIHCIIPARSGSKGIKDKNIQLLNGKPLIAYSIELALSTSLVSKVIVSTDSEEYAKICREYGADVPFLRPLEISNDYSTDLEFLQHYLNWNKKQKSESYPYPDAIFHLRPTFPFRKIDEMEKAINLFIESWDTVDSLRSIIPSPKSPYKMYHIENNKLIPLYRQINEIKEPYNVGRQMLPQTYLHNGCYDIIKSSTIENGSCTGDNIMPFLMTEEDSIDIDTPIDLEKCKIKIESKLG